MWSSDWGKKSRHNKSRVIVRTPWLCVIQLQQVQYCTFIYAVLQHAASLLFTHRNKKKHSFYPVRRNLFTINFNISIVPQLYSTAMWNFRAFFPEMFISDLAWRLARTSSLAKWFSYTVQQCEIFARFFLKCSFQISREDWLEHRP
jgi:hypothetical protein